MKVCAIAKQQMKIQPFSLIHLHTLHTDSIDLVNRTEVDGTLNVLDLPK